MDVSLKLKLKEYFQQLGLSEEEFEMYLALNGSEPLSVLEISRKTKIPRTTSYRLLLQLKEMGLVEEIMNDRSASYQASSPDKIQLLLKQEETKFNFLKQNFPEITSILAGQKQIDQPGTKVLFYRGREGIRQEAWNILTSGEKTWSSYLPSSFVQAVGLDYAELFFREMKLRQISLREILSDRYYESVDEEYEDMLSLKFDALGLDIESRYLPREKLDVNHLVDIYGEVVSFFSYVEGDYYGVEIYNKNLSAFQKQLFEITWQISQPYLSYKEWSLQTKSEPIG